MESGVRSTGSWLVIGLGLLAAFLFALSAFLQQRAAHADRGTESVVGGLATLMGRLLRDRAWLAAWVVNLVGFVTQAFALRAGSVAAVAPLMSTQLLFAMPMASLDRRTWPRARDWASAGSICGGLVILQLVGGGSQLDGRPHDELVLVATLAAVAFGAALVVVAARVGRTAASVLTAAAAGLCFAMSAVFIKLTIDNLDEHGVGYTAASWPGYALAGSALLGLVLEQAAFANGSLPWSVATMNSVNPVVGYAVGILAFDVALPTGAGPLVGIAVAGLLIVLGGFGLAHSPSASLWIADPAVHNRDGRKNSPGHRRRGR